MARNNRVSVQGDLTGDIYYDVIQKDGRVIPFLRVYMMINNSSTAGEVRGLRVMFYGLLAEEAEAHLQKGSRIEVEIVRRLGARRGAPTKTRSASVPSPTKLERG